MALTAQLKGRQAAVVVQVGRGLLQEDTSWCSSLAMFDRIRAECTHLFAMGEEAVV
jgi:hypothetical protein